MALLRAFGRHLPERVVSNDELGALVGVEPEWIREVSGIRERRFAAPGETVVDLAVGAGRDCLEGAGITAAEVGMVIVASGTAERRFPGPAASVAHRLGTGTAPALDLPIASAGSLVGLFLADRLAPGCGNVLVVAAEKMSAAILGGPLDPATAVLFGDGAGACLVSAETGFAEIVDCTIQSDGAFADELHLEHDKPLVMNGRSVILHASRKIPRSITALLDRHGKTPRDVHVYLVHQANANLLARVAQGLGVEMERFFCNIDRYGNTSSASMLIAAAEWRQREVAPAGALLVFAGFGAGFHWGGLLARCG